MVAVGFSRSDSPGFPPAPPSKRQRRGSIPAWANGPGHRPRPRPGLKARPKSPAHHWLGRAFGPLVFFWGIFLGRWPRLVWSRAFGPAAGLAGKHNGCSPRLPSPGRYATPACGARGATRPTTVAETTRAGFREAGELVIQPVETQRRSLVLGWVRMMSQTDSQPRRPHQSEMRSRRPTAAHQQAAEV